MTSATPAPGILYLVPNLLGIVPPDDVLPQRTLAVARSLEHFVVETPKAARQFILGLRSTLPIRSIKMATLNVDTPRDHIAGLLDPVLRGNGLGLLSDAGCPAVADPGALLVSAAHRAGVRVVPLVGPSAILLALMACGMNGQQFAFHGYLPVAAEARARALKILDDAAAKTGVTQLFIETPYRNDVMLGAILESCRASTELCVACDLTLPSEQIVRKPINRWRIGAPLLLKGRPALFLLGVG